MKNKAHLLLVVNPISGGTDKQKLLSEIGGLLEARHLSFSTYETTGNDDVAHIRKQLKEQNIGKILVVGGDGTILTVAKAIEEMDVAVGIFPAGSANGLAANLSLPAPVEEQVDIALGKDVLMMDVLDINGHPSLHLADIGINATLIKNYDNASLRGKLGYALQTIPTLIEADLPYDFTLHLNGQTLHKKGVMITIANARQYGTGAVVNPDGKMDDGQFEVLLFKNLGMLNILKTLDSSSALDPNFVECFRTTEAVIETPQPLPFQVDGEYVGEENRISARLMPYKLKVMVPRQVR